MKRIYRCNWLSVLLKFVVLSNLIFSQFWHTGLVNDAKAQAPMSTPPPMLNFPIQAPWPAGITWVAGDTGSYFHEPPYHINQDDFAIDFNASDLSDKDVLVLAVAGGEVVKAGNDGGYGYSVVIDHGGGYESRYAHLRDQPLVKKNDRITPGTPLGYVGKTGGTSTGEHLHFAVYYCDPNDYKNGVCTKVQATNPVPFEGLSSISNKEQITSTNYGVGFEAFSDYAIKDASKIIKHPTFINTYQALGGKYIFGVVESPVKLWNNGNTRYQEFGSSGNQTAPWVNLKSALLESKNQPYLMMDPIWSVYKSINGPSSSLGLPITHTYGYYRSLPNSLHTYELRNDFENGSITGSPYGNTKVITSKDAQWNTTIYSTTTFSYPTLQRRDEYIDFEWVPIPASMPVQLGSHLGASVIWEGQFGKYIKAYTLNVKVQGYVQILANGKEILKIDSPDAIKEGTSTRIGFQTDKIEIRFSQDYYKTARISVTSKDLLNLVQPVYAFESQGMISFQPPPSSTETFLLYEPPPYPGTSSTTQTPVPQTQGNSATALVMDVSGSMADFWQGGVKIESAKAAANQIVNMLEQENQLGGASHRLGLLSFSSDIVSVQDVTTDFNQARLAINSMAPSGRTNIGSGLTAANSILTAALPNEQKIIILLSDGMTNTGLSPDEIINGPVQDAVRAGICIYTVGFGDTGDIDEPLLQRIAQASGCGQYYYALDVAELEKIYIKIRHQSTGTILAEFSGNVSQGQTVQAGTVNVPSSQGELAVSLYWPGSKMQLILHDPQGAIVDQNSPNVKIVSYSNLVYALIMDPLPGAWLVEVYGEQLSQPSENFDVVVSARAAPYTPVPPTTVPPTPAPKQPTAGPDFGRVLVLLALSGGAIGVYVYSTALKRKRGHETIPGNIANPLSTASLTILNGSRAGQVVQLYGETLTLGRGSGNSIYLPDESVSRSHALLRFTEGNWYIQDQNSRYGTFVNNQPIQGQRLDNGDRIKAGKTELVFYLDSR